MMPYTMIAQINQAQRSIQEHFRQGGSWLTFLLVFFLIGSLVWITYYLTKRQQRTVELSREVNHQRLFEDLLNKLEFTTTQRQRLESMANDLRLEHPTTLLLAPGIFDRCVERWKSVLQTAGNKIDDRTGDNSLSNIRGILFPYTKEGFVDSRSFGGS